MNWQEGNLIVFVGCGALCNCQPVLTCAEQKGTHTKNTMTLKPMFATRQDVRSIPSDNYGKLVLIEALTDIRTNKKTQHVPSMSASIDGEIRGCRECRCPPPKAQAFRRIQQNRNKQTHTHTKSTSFNKCNYSFQHEW